MDRRLLISSAAALVGAQAIAPLARAQDEPPGDDRPPPAGSRSPPPNDYRSGPSGDARPMPPPGEGGDYPNRHAPTYSQDELVHSVSDFFGVTAESAGAIIERIFHDNGQPTGYIAGEEASGAFAFGLRYGKGLLYMKDRPRQEVYWQGPSIGFDVGGNASRVFTLCYNLQFPDMIYRRFPGVEGSAYFIGGLGVNYQRAEDITLAPIRAGVGLRLGANLGYLAYSRQRHILPF